MTATKVGPSVRPVSSSPGSTMRKTSATSRSARWVVPALILFPLMALVGRFALSAIPPEPSSRLAVLGSAPSFSLTERSGRTVTAKDLRGSVWIADFIFTTCAGPCPELTLRMRSLQEALKRNRSRARLVTFTVDPSYDTPDVLRAYAEHYGAHADLWWFLTTQDEPAMHTLIEKGFLQTVIPADHDGPIIHSTYLVLVDRRGRIRGFYNGLDPASNARIMRDVESLLREPEGE